RRHTRSLRDWSSDVCSSDLLSAESSAHHIGGVGAEVVNVGAAETDLIERGADVTGRHLMRHLELHQCPASELDAVIETPGQEERSEERRVGKECRSGRWASR